MGTCSFFVEPFFLLGSNESIPPLGPLLQQTVIANWNILMSKKGKEGKRKERKEERRTNIAIEKQKKNGRKEGTKKVKEEETTNQT